jgi:hypothetical protein
VANPHRSIQQLLVKSGDLGRSTPPCKIWVFLTIRFTIKYKASHHYNHVKGGKCKGVELVPLKLVVNICFVICQWLVTSHPPPWPSPLHFLKLTSHLSLFMLASIVIHVCFPSFLIAYISSIKLLGITNSSYLVVEDHRCLIMHHSTKDHLIFACTKYVIKLELWFVHERDFILYGFFHKSLTRNDMKILLSWCQLSNNYSYVQERLERSSRYCLPMK